MKRRMLLTFVVILLLSMAASARAYQTREKFDIEKMVDVLREVENWDGKSVGAAQERGPWQITQTVWQQFSDTSFKQADRKSSAALREQRYVARECVIWIVGRLEKAGYSITPYNVALVWCAGWGSFHRHDPRRPSHLKQFYAERASNIYYHTK